MSNNLCLPLEWSGLVLLLTGVLLFMISFGCNHADGNIIDDNNRTPWEWVDRFEMRLAPLLNPIRSFVSFCGLVLVISGLGLLLLWFIGHVSMRS